MKTFIFIISTFVIAFTASAQESVGIGTTSPNTKAILDLTSTTKGFLMPRMTYSNRNGIASPPQGLMVYQTNNNTIPPSLAGVYFFDGTSWKRIARSDEIGGGGNNSWTISGDDQYSNLAGNVGIGTSSPTSKFHIVGSILQEGSTFALNHSSGILQFRNSDVNKAYVQLSGQNLRMGTNSGNSAGGIVFRLDGTERMVIDSSGDVGIGTTSPDTRLHVYGGILKVERPGTALGVPLSPIVSFEISDENDKKGGFTFSRSGTILSKLLYVNRTAGPNLFRFGMSDPEALDLVITDAGRVGVNMNSVASSFEGQLHVRGASGVDEIALVKSVEGQSPTIQFHSTQSNGLPDAKEAFIQLDNGDDLRLGTNSGNSTGKVVFRLDGSDHAAITPDGKMGIGTVSPTAKIQVVGGDGAGLNSDGYIHLGIASSTNLILDNNEIQARLNGQGSKLYLQRSGGTLDIGGHTTITNNGQALRIDGSTPNIGFYHNSSYKSFIAQGTSNLTIGVNGGKLHLDATQIAIGTLTSDAAAYKLAVGGKAICEELRVELVADWPDYVFANDYKLTPLCELKTFIEKNHHLPNIPKASEIHELGLDVGEMNRKLMEKIEELTLYVIHLQEQIDELKSGVDKN